MRHVTKVWELLQGTVSAWNYGDKTFWIEYKPPKAEPEAPKSTVRQLIYDYISSDHMILHERTYEYWFIGLDC